MALLYEEKGKMHDLGGTDWATRTTTVTVFTQVIATKPFRFLRLQKFMMVLHHQ